MSTTRKKKATALLVAVTSLATAMSSTGAQEGDLDCGDPGTHHNMPVPIDDDPHDLDRNNDGVGCEDPSVFGDTSGSATTMSPAPTTPTSAAPAPSPTPAPSPSPTSPPAEPVVTEPHFTG